MKTEARFTVDGIHIRDREGRIVLFRGCNLGGDSKIPSRPEGNPLSYDVSFTGRPFPEDEADAHFARLALWGFTFLRVVVTWEAIEHAGPGVYDEDYLAYLRNVLKKAEAHGISVFIDPHQDVWSRWTGGDGAPGWTLEAVGFDPEKIAASGAAFTVASEGKNYRQMSWGLNYLRYANATMWTLFFGGNTFAPGKYVEGVPVQDWLQDHFIDAMKHAARRLKDVDAIVGFGTLNEPHYGYIGLASLDTHHRITSPAGAVPTAFQSIAAASGFPQAVKRVGLAGMVTLPGKEILNPDGVSLFRDGARCPWLEAGVWAVEGGVPVVKKTDWFLRVPEWVKSGSSSAATGAGNSALSGADSGDPLSGGSFAEYFLKPFQKRFMEALSKKHGHYIFFVEGVPHAHRASWTAEDRLDSDGKPYSIVEAFHWYDGMTLLFKKWHSWMIADSETSAPSFGPGAAARSVRAQLARLAARPRGDNIPAFLGEFGVPFDLSRGRSYRSGSYREQETALGAYYDAVDAVLVHSTIWNYSASNTHEAGDGWNTEDLSIYCATTGEGRAVRGFSRPYAMAVAGMPVSMEFDRKKRVFTFEWDAVDGITEIFVPSHWYPEGWRASFVGENAVLEEKPEARRLLVSVTGGGRARVVVAPVACED
jgi:hypothetical protein